MLVLERVESSQMYASDYIRYIILYPLLNLLEIVIYHSGNPKFKQTRYSNMGSGSRGFFLVAQGVRNLWLLSRSFHSRPMRWQDVCLAVS